VRASLRPLLMCIVLANLAFVYITEAARVTWLLPLVTLTLASPLLVRLRGRLWYRILWNGSVVSLFALLVHHATSAGVHRILEDGFLLAALCQVHLLNNIGADQKPDLLFFNSFLIAVVTSFLSLDLEYSIVFLFYAPVLVTAMLVLNLSSLSVESARGLLPRVLRAGASKAAVALGLTMLVFFVWPRDFHRKGLFGDRLGLAPRGSFLDVDFSDEVSLDRSGPARASGRVVMRISVEAGVAPGVPAHWRGATLSRFDGRDWKRHGIGAGEAPWRPEGRGRWIRDEGAQGVRAMTVDLVDPGATRLFAPRGCRRLHLHFPADPRRLEPLGDQTLVYPRVRDRRPVRYTLTLQGRRSEPPRSAPSPNREHLWLASSAVPSVARRLTRLIADSLPDDAPQSVVVERVRRHLSKSYEYLLPGAEGASRNLNDFLSGRSGGHCEFFATGLVVLLRLQRVPCRLVTGFRSEEWDEEERVLTVRARHAHAWVEVLDPEAGWVTVDPSPAVSSGLEAATAGPFAGIRRFASKLWERVTAFNADARLRSLAWLRSSPGRLLDTGRRHPLGLAALAVLGAGLVTVRVRRRRRRSPAAVRAYARAVRRAGMRTRSGETPRELLERARVTAVRPRRLSRLRDATRLHESGRYAVKSGPDPVR